MKKILTALLVSTLIAPSILLAQQMVTEKNTFPLTHWTSKSSSDAYIIQNGAGTPIMIHIKVDGGTRADNLETPGVNVKNCGTTTHIKAGGSTVCETNDANNPVTLTSESGTEAASGTYQIQSK